MLETTATTDFLKICHPHKLPKSLYGWQKAAREGRLEIGLGAHTPQSAMSLAEELAALRRQVRELDKDNQRLREENAFLEEASAFFAASRRKSARTRG